MAVVATTVLLIRTTAVMTTPSPVASPGRGAPGALTFSRPRHWGRSGAHVVVRWHPAA